MRGEDKPELGIRKMQFLLDLARGRSDVHLVDIGDEVYITQSMPSTTWVAFNGSLIALNLPCNFYVGSDVTSVAI